MSSQTLPRSWQFAQPPLTPAWIWIVVGAGVAKRVPGGLNVALPGTSADGFDALWQVSQVVPEGICDPAPAGELGGITTMRVMP